MPSNKEKRKKSLKKKKKNWFDGVEQMPIQQVRQVLFPNIFKLMTGRAVPVKYERARTPPGETGVDILRQLELQKAAERARKSAEKKAKKEGRTSPKAESSNVQEPKPQRASAVAARDTISRAMTPDDEFFEELLESQDIV